MSWTAQALLHSALNWTMPETARPVPGGNPKQDVTVGLDLVRAASPSALPDASRARRAAHDATWELAGDDCGAGQAILSRSRGLRPGVDVSQAHSPLGSWPHDSDKRKHRREGALSRPRDLRGLHRFRDRVRQLGVAHPPGS